MNKRPERLINKIYKDVFNKIFKEVKKTKTSTLATKAAIETNLLRLKNSEQYQKFAEKFSKKLTTAGLSKTKGLWRKYYEAAKERRVGILPSTFTEFQKTMLRKTIEHNFNLIKSIPDEVMKVYKLKYVDTLIDQIAEGKVGRKEFEKVLKTSGAKRAKLVARTEAAKLQTAIDRNSSTELGSVCYQWLSSNDKRTRPSHKAMNGVIVFWRNDDNEKPLLDNMRGDAGEFPNCRCTPLTIFDENDLKASRYKVYNYKTDKIITMNKSDLLKAIKNKGL